jgi:hypothetical protein
MFGLRYKPPPDDELDDLEEERPIIPFEDLDPVTQAEVLKTRHFIKMVGWISIGAIGFMIMLTIVAVALAAAN